MIATVPCTHCDDLFGAGEPALCGLCVRKELEELRAFKMRIAAISNGYWNACDSSLMESQAALGAIAFALGEPFAEEK